MTSMVPNGNFHVEALLTHEALNSAFTALVEGADRIWMAYAWASGDDTAAHLKALDLGKIEMALVGVDGCNTDPKAIAELHRTGKLRIMEPSGALFHPKLLVAQGPDGWCALVGSSNFTGGGFERNIEANVLIADSAGDQVERLCEFIQEHWHRAVEPTPEWLTDYGNRWQERRRQRKGEVKPPLLPRKDRLVENLSELAIGWDDYYRLIRDHRRTGPDGRVISVLEHDGKGGSYIEEIEACQRAFHHHGPAFADIPQELRLRIAGAPGKSTGHFGNMAVAAHFLRAVRESPEDIARELDRIPSKGPVSAELAESVFAALDKLNRVGHGAVSRLLCVKRPDLFLSANNASIKRQGAMFGKQPKNASAYMDMVRRIWEMPWFNADEPEDEEQRRIWKARVALLDALFYEP